MNEVTKTDSSPQQTVSLTAEQALQQAITFHQAGNLQDAERLYRTILQAYPNHSDANHNLGVLAVQVNQPVAGLPHFKAALEANPNQAAYWLSYVDALIKAGQTDSARQVLEQGQKLGLRGEAVETLIGRIQKHSVNEPSTPEIDTLAGLFNEGRFSEAATLAQTMTERFPLHGFAWKVLGVVYKKMGRSEDALEKMQHAAALSLNDPEAHNNLGFFFQETNHLPEAEAAYRRALELGPDYAEAHYNLGLLLQKTKRLCEAEAAYHRAIELKPDYAEAHNNLGLLFKEKKRLHEAKTAFLSTIELKPDFVEAYNNLGNILHETKHLPEAEAVYRRALELKPDSVEIHNNLGFLLQETKLMSEAEVAYLHALKLNPDFVEAHNNLGYLYQETRRLPEAEAAYLCALKLRPDYAETHYNLGFLFQETKRHPEAEAAYRRALEIQPDYAEAKFNLSFLLLILGRYAEAWPYYESRYAPNRKGNASEVPRVSYPQWQGESLVGKSLVIYPEQGFGDYIQFCRYVPMLKNCGVACLTCVCDLRLKKLLDTVEGIDAVFTDIASAPPHDYWSFPLSLPLYFSTTVDTIPAVLPYIHALPERVCHWHERMPQKGIRVGLTWKGSPSHKNDANRSLPSLATLAPLWSVPGVTFISLQKGQGEAEAMQPPAEQPLINFGSDIHDFADTAAIIAQVDLLICVDTAVAHVAGAIGKPCWVLLPAFGSDWRWLLDRTDSPWYPRVMRIFRQSKPNDWDDTIGDVVAALQTLVSPIKHETKNTFRTDQ